MQDNEVPDLIYTCLLQVYFEKTVCVVVTTNLCKSMIIIVSKRGSIYFIMKLIAAYASYSKFY
jgi:hypothetical protein